MEADVYRSFTGSHVIKLIGYKHARLMTPLEFLDNRISLWNHIFPDTAYTLIGITRDPKGYFRFVIQQPYVQKGGHIQENELIEFMEKSLGMKPFDAVEPTTFINRFYNINDLHLKNVIKSPDGTILFIDGVTILNEPDEGMNGIRAYPDFDVFDAEPGYETTGFDQSQYFAGLPPQPETPSFSLGGNDKSEEAKIRLRSFLVTNPDHDFEPIAAKLIAAGLISKDEADDILHGWRQTRARALSRDAALEAVMDMEELLHLRRKDERDNGQVNNAILREIVEAEAANTDLGDLSKRYSPYRIKEMVEEVAASGLAHPGTVLESLQRLNQDETEPLGGPKLTVAVQIALTELNAAAEQYQEVFNRTGDLGAAEMLSYIADIKARIAWEAEIQGSRAGAALGIRSQLIALAGLTYESEIDALEKLAKSKAGTGADVSDHDKAEIKRLINELNALKKAAKEAETTNLVKKAAAVDTGFYRRCKSSLEANPTLTK